MNFHLFLISFQYEAKKKFKMGDWGWVSVCLWFFKTGFVFVALAEIHLSVGIKDAYHHNLAENR